MVYFLVPVYNEALNIELLSRSILDTLPDEEKFYVFVDDGSTDDTVKKLKELFSPSCSTILVKQKNAGPGDSFNRGMNWILSHCIDETSLLVSIEADNTSDLSILPKLIDSARGGIDLVLASVYLPGGQFEQTSWLKKVVSWIANSFIRFVFNLKIQTLSSFYRVYTVAILRQVKQKYGVIIEEPGFVSMVEVVIKISSTNGKISEIPTTVYSKKRKGRSKMKIIPTVFSYLKFAVKKF